MKTVKTVLAIVMVALISFTYTACEDTPAESCEQQDMNEILNCGSEKNVEVCCTTDSDCVYKFEGLEYPDTNAGLNDLADALGCTTKSSVENNAQKELIITYLIALRERAKDGFY